MGVWLRRVMVVLLISGLAGAVQPRVGVFITAEDILVARDLMETEGWARREARSILTNAQFWLSMPDDWYYQIIPPQGSTFAYGINGAPGSSAQWTNFGGGGIAHLDRPGILYPPGSVPIDFANPESRFYDPGNGVQIGGQTYYFQGVWNAYVVNQLAGWNDDGAAVHQLAYAYALTGDPAYAQKAALILDALATLHATTIGPRDFQRNPTSVEGRLHYLTSIVNRAKVHFARTYDLIFHGVDLRQISPTNPDNYGKEAGFTMQANIEENLLRDYLFDEFDLRGGELSNLQNHESDAVRALLAVGLVLGEPDYIRWGLDAAYALLENTIDRDGHYYETSPSYGVFTQGIFADLAEMAHNYRPDAEGFPRREEYPYNLDLYSHPRLRNFFFGFWERLDMAGHFPSFGNSGENTKRVQSPWRTITDWEFDLADRLYIRTGEPSYLDFLLLASGGDLTSRRKGSWALFHAGSSPAASGVEIQPPIQESQFFGATTLAILRSGEGIHRRVALMRGGPNLVHAHDDALGLLIYDQGYLITRDVGYFTFGSPVHYGWAERSASHNLVVIDEDQGRAPFFKRGPGADLHSFTALPGLQQADMSVENQFPAEQGIETYRRRVSLRDIDEFNSYTIDLFWVQGGKTHDYFFHGLAPRMEIAGLTPVEIPGAWTLAGLSQPGATFNAPGKSWGERIIPGQYIRNLGTPGEEVGGMYWNPPPRNGYGFIYNLKGAPAQGPLDAAWQMNDGTRLQMTVLPQAEMTVYTAMSPDAFGHNPSPSLILRRQGDPGLSSLFLSVIQAFRGEAKIHGIHQHPATGGVRLEIDLGNLGTDHWLLGSDPQISAEGMALHGWTGVVRERDGEVQSIHLLDGKELSWGPHVLTLEHGEYTGEILSIDYRNLTVLVTGSIPRSLVGQEIVFNHPEYRRNTSYTIAAISPDSQGSVIKLSGPMELGRSVVQRTRASARNNMLQTKVPIPTSHVYEYSSGLLEGKAISDMEYNLLSTVTEVRGLRLMDVSTVEGLLRDDPFYVLDIKVGDTYRIGGEVAILRQDDGFHVQGTGQVTLWGGWFGGGGYRIQVGEEIWESQDLVIPLEEHGQARFWVL